MLTLLNKISAKSTILVCHPNADPDALFSAYALSKLLSRLAPQLETQIVVPYGLTRLSKKVLESIPTNVVSAPILDKVDAVILLDTNNLQQLNDYGKQIEAAEKPVLIIDHHTVNPETKRASTLQIIDEQASSTCEIVFKLFEQTAVKPRVKEAQALFIGIAYDTRRFSIANSKTFRIATALINLGAVAEEALALLEMSLDTSERVARLKAAGRLRVVRIGEWVLALSNVSSFQASAARALVGLGAHIAVVGGNRGKVVRVNMRSSREFFVKTRIHLGRDLAKPLGGYFGGFGGGHSTAAGVNGEGELKLALAICLKLIREKLEFNASVC